MSKAPSKDVQKVAAEIAGNCLAMRVRYLNRSLTSIYDDAFRSLGITASQVSVLVAVVTQGTPSPGELGNILNIEKSTLSRSLKLMRTAGWIEVIAPETGRTHAIEASQKGKKLVLKVLPIWREAQDEAGDLLGGEGSKTLREVSDHARKGLMNS